ncbi:MAG: hypothetical protein QW156_04975 [Candidatus Aenigmatarchaeota archaeon]
MLKIKEFYTIMADGTGFGYDETIKLSYLRGKELRNVENSYAFYTLFSIFIDFSNTLMPYLTRIYKIIYTLAMFGLY